MAIANETSEMLICHVNKHSDGFNLRGRKVSHTWAEVLVKFGRLASHLSIFALIRDFSRRL